MPPDINKHVPYAICDYNDYHHSYVKELKKAFSASRIDDIYRDIYENERVNAEKPISEGQKMYKRLVRNITDTKNLKLLPYQLKMCEMVLHCLIPGVYGSDYMKNKENILKDHGIERVCREVMCIAMRRIGKSVGMAFLACDVALSIKNDGRAEKIIAEFSVNMRAAEGFIKECVSALRCIPYSKKFKIRVKANEIVFENRENPLDIRIIKSFCSSNETVSTTRLG